MAISTSFGSGGSLLSSLESSGALPISPRISQSPSISNTRLMPIISRHFETSASISVPILLERGFTDTREAVIRDLRSLARRVRGNDPVVSTIVALGLGVAVGRCESRIEASMLREICDGGQHKAQYIKLSVQI